MFIVITDVCKTKVVLLNAVLIKISIEEINKKHFLYLT